jgi:hypothetical protein
MSSTPSNSRATNAALSLRLTPSNSPFYKSSPSRSPVKSIRQDLNLSLKQVIGTTASSSNGFDSLRNAQTFAYTAGAAAVVATVDSDSKVSQRFFRARPTTSPVNPTTSIYGTSSPAHITSDSRSRAATTLRDVGVSSNAWTPPPADWLDSPGQRTWSARERVKAATSVSLSPDGKFLAVGEVCEPI